MTPDEMIAEREKTHGSFEMNAHMWKRYCLVADHIEMTEGQKLAMTMIFLKISRIMCGDPMIKDHWDDIAGYAKLGSQACKS